MIFCDMEKLKETRKMSKCVAVVAEKRSKIYFTPCEPLTVHITLFGAATSRTFCNNITTESDRQKQTTTTTTNKKAKKKKKKRQRQMKSKETKKRKSCEIRLPSHHCKCVFHNKAQLKYSHSTGMSKYLQNDSERNERTVQRTAQRRRRRRSCNNNHERKKGI